MKSATRSIRMPPRPAIRTLASSAVRQHGQSAAGAVDRLGNAPRRQRRFVETWADAAERVGHGVGDGGRRRDGAAFAEAFDAVFRGLSRMNKVRYPHRWNLRRARHHVLAKQRGERLTDLVVGDFLVERGADALRDASLHLAVD